MKQKDGAIKNIDSCEKSFYELINALAYSKFSEVMFETKNELKKNDNKALSQLYKDFFKSKADFSKAFGQDLYENIILIVDEFCLEMLKNFVSIGHNYDSNGKQKIDIFCNENNKNIESIYAKYRENIANEMQKNGLNNQYIKIYIGEFEKTISCYDYVKNFVKDLKKEDPQKLQELIDFEMSRKELKDSANRLRIVVEGVCNLPPNIIFSKTRELSNQMKAEKLVKKSSCTIL